MWKLVVVWLGALIMIAPQALAAQELVDQPIPREYPRSNPGSLGSIGPANQAGVTEAEADAAEQACNAQNFAACADLGEAFRTGTGRPRNRPVAELLHRKACERGVGKGCHGLGTLLKTTDQPDDQRLAAGFHARACRLDWLAGCDAEANDLASGALGQPDPQAAEALRRATCGRGGLIACRTLAAALLGRDRSSADRDEGMALLDRQCGADDFVACEDAIRSLDQGEEPAPTALIEGFRQRACDAGSARSCRELANAALASDLSAAGRTAALVYFDRACQLWDGHCRDAAEVRDAPVLGARCDAGDQSACITLGRLLSVLGGLQEDRPRALALLGAACDAGATAQCQPAADLVFAMWDAIGPSAPARAEAYLAGSCGADISDACEALADELASGERLAQDTARAAALYHPQCDAGRIVACDFLQMQVLNDPAGPLPLAHADLAPALTPEEEQELAARATPVADEYCTTTIVTYEGRSYSDTTCVFVGGAIRGFAARQGETPWQALLWRPETLNPGTRNALRLTPADQVLCGGSVIRTGWILTAGHCLTDDRGKVIDTAGYRVRLGLSNPYAEEGLSYPILRVIPHPKFCRTKPCPRSLDFDVALVQYDPTRNSMSGRVLPVSRIRLDPLPLAARKLETVERVFTYGWGRTEVVGGSIPDHLRGARVKLRDAATCTNITRFTDAERRDTVLCADERVGAGGGQACKGDSGGPLITYGDTDQRPTLIGVVSGGAKCGSIGKPSRFVRVAHPAIISWINATLNPASRR